MRKGQKKKWYLIQRENLKKDAFLKVYYDKDTGVKTWEEVKKR
ncbi:DUF1093 domain-containing protein [Bacillus cereus]